MEIKTYIKNLRISPKKLRLIANQIKKIRPVDALNVLLYDHKRGAKILLKAIGSAISSAKRHYKIDENLLRFKLLTIENGPSLKRFRAGGRGITKPYRKRTSYIKIVLSGESTLDSNDIISMGTKIDNKKNKKLIIAK